MSAHEELELVMAEDVLLLAFLVGGLAELHC